MGIEQEDHSAPDNRSVPIENGVGTHEQPPEPEHLISETALEELVEEGDDLALQPAPKTDEPPEITSLFQTLKSQDASPNIIETSNGYILRFDLKAGRSTRSVSVNVEGAKILMGADVSAWRSLQRYDGIWSQAEGTVEIVLRDQRFGGSLTYWLRRLTGTSEANHIDPVALEIHPVDEQARARLQIGSASDIASVLLAGPRWLRRGLITMRISGIAVSTADDADNLAEQVADSVSVDFDIASGVLFTPQRLEDRSALRARRLRPPRSPRFPRNNYPHAAVVPYRAGRVRTNTPLIRYWSYYQVLEYFFPKYSQADALNQVGRLLRSPAFDAYRDEQVLKVIELATNARTGSVTEEQQLLTTIKAITSTKELLDVVESADLVVHLENRKSELTQIAVTVAPTDDLLVQLARRIYDIRCRIVHSKSSSERDPGPGLLPGTHHDDLVERELPLMEYLAQQALVTSAEPLILPTRPNRDEFGRMEE